MTSDGRGSDSQAIIGDRRSPATAVVVTGVAVLVTLVWLAWPTKAAGLTTETPPPTSQTDSHPAAVDESVQRVEVAVAPAAVRSFAADLDQLVELGVALSQAIDRHERDQAEDLDAQARELLAQMRATFADADERAVQNWHGGPPGPELCDEVRPRALAHLIELGLHDRHARAGGAGESLQGLLTMLLIAIPKDRQRGEAMAALLVDQPYLGLAQESIVMEMVAESTQVLWLRPVAANLLHTLWRNLEARGERSAADTTSLAMLLKDHADPVRRLAALRQLLESTDRRFRELAITETLQRQDAELARELALAVANRLEPREALDALERLVPLLGSRSMASFMVLGTRDATLLHTTYVERLAANTDPALRAELVSGAAFDGGTTGVELAQLAFHQDSDAEVRCRAMFALTARAATAVGEQVLHTALDDLALGHDPHRLAQIVLALENVARAGEVNAVDRVAQRLRGRRELSESSRQQLQEIVRKYLPGR